MDNFRGLNRLFDSVSDAESHDMKILTGFLRNPIQEILIKTQLVALKKYCTFCAIFETFYIRNGYMLFFVISSKTSLHLRLGHN